MTPLADPRVAERFPEVLEAVNNQYGAPTSRRRPGEPVAAWISRLYDADRFFTTVRLLAEHCPPGGRVADVGAWPGHFTVCLQRLGWSMIGVDKSVSRSVELGQSALFSTSQTSGPPRLSFDQLCRQEGVEPTNADIECEPLRLASDSLDAVVLTEVIEHVWHNPLFVLAEINRVLKPGTGTLILSTPNLLSIRNRIEFMRGHIERVIENPFVSFLKAQRLGHLGHLRLYAPAELLTLMRLTGFTCAVSYETIPRGDPSELEASSPVSESRPGEPARPARRPRFVHRLFKTPAGYAEALLATITKVGEQRYPQLRGRIFVVARKIADADFDRNYPNELRHLITHNILPSSQ